MTKKLEDLFNLEEQDSTSQTKEEPETISAPTHEDVHTLDRSYKEVSEITRDLPAIKELDNLDEGELDNLATKAEQAYDDLMDLGMNVEVRYSGRIFEVASSMMKNAVDAKTAKIDKKLKAIDLQLKKYKIDKDSSPVDDNEVISGEGFVVTDRNELLKKLGKQD